MKDEEDEEVGIGAGCEGWVGLMNIDFVPSTKRPPSGGPFTGDCVRVFWPRAEEGPAPGLSASISGLGDGEGEKVPVGEDKDE